MRVAALSSRRAAVPSNMRHTSTTPAMRLGTAVLLDLLQHVQFGPVQVGNHRHVRQDMSRGIVQWREVVEVENQRGERTQPEPADGTTSPPAAWPALEKPRRECGQGRQACPHTTHAAAPAGPTGPPRAARHPEQG